MKPNHIAARLVRRLSRPRPAPALQPARECEASLSRSRDGRRMVLCGPLDGYVLEQVAVATHAGYDRVEIALIPQYEDDDATRADLIEAARRDVAQRFTHLERRGVRVNVRLLSATRSVRVPRPAGGRV